MTGDSARRRAEALAAAGDAEAQNWFAGAEGERRVAEALTGLPEGWTAIHDRLLMPGLTESNLDHILVGPTGLILVDAKNFSGTIRVWNDSAYQHLGAGSNRSTRNLVAELEKIRWMAIQMGSRLGAPVTSVMCLAGNRQGHFGAAELVRGVWIVPLDGLVTWLASLPGRMPEEDVRRLVPRVMSEFPSTATDPDLLAAIGRDLARTVPTRKAGRTRRTRAGRHASGPSRAPRPPGPAPARPAQRPRSRGGLWRLARLGVIAAALFWGIPHLPSIGQQFGSVLGAHLGERVSPTVQVPVAEPVATPDPVSMLESETDPVVAGDLPGDDLSCDALSEERLSTYLKTPAVAWHSLGGTCMWFLDRSDPSSLVLEARRVSADALGHRTGDTVGTFPSAGVAPPGRSSVLVASEGQWIPVADTRTAVKWPMRIEIFRQRLDIDHHRGDQILRAVAADLNS